MYKGAVKSPCELTTWTRAVEPDHQKQQGHEESLDPATRLGGGALQPIVTPFTIITASLAPGGPALDSFNRANLVLARSQM